MLKSIALFLLLAGTAASAQDLPPLPPETMILVQDARAVAPEFSADVLLRLAGSDAIANPEWKRQLIEEAFKTGSKAHLPYRKAGEGNTDARASRAHWENGLEALTLQTRAVDAMLELDPPRARALFEEIQAPQVPAMACAQTGEPNLAAYYQTAANVFARGFIPSERERNGHTQFLQRIIGQMQTPAHVTPAVKLIFTAEMTERERKDLVSDFAALLPRINGSPRVFGAVMFQLVPVSAPPRLPPGVRPAAPLLEAPAGQIPPEVASTASVLLPALRGYIVRHISATRCSENFRAPLTTAGNDFNYLAAALDPAGAVYKPISPDEARPAADGGAYELHSWWMSERSRKVLDALKWLNHGNRTDAANGRLRFFTPEERQSPEWVARFEDTLRLIEGWKESEEGSPEDWFGMVSEALELLAEKPPEGRIRNVAMSRYLTFMETHYASLPNPNLWFTQLKSQWKSKDPWIAEQMANSKNPVISLYARMNKALDRNR